MRCRGINKGDNMNYRELCVDIFGTDQPECLIGIAEKAKKYDLLYGSAQVNNPRNAGRKPKLRTEDVESMKNMHMQGITKEQLRRLYNRRDRKKISRDQTDSI